MTAYVFLLLALTTTVILGGGLVLVSRAKRMLEDSRSDDSPPHVESREFLADNWALVEQSALNHGMTAEELSEVRRRVFSAELPPAS